MKRYVERGPPCLNPHEVENVEEGFPLIKTEKDAKVTQITTQVIYFEQNLNLDNTFWRKDHQSLS